MTFIPILLSTWRNLERRGRLATASPACFVPARRVERAPPVAGALAITAAQLGYIMLEGDYYAGGGLIGGIRNEPAIRSSGLKAT
jgi:hypothetical protein